MAGYIIAGMIYGIVITLALQGMVKIVRVVNRRRRAKLVARITAEVAATFTANPAQMRTVRSHSKV